MLSLQELRTPRLLLRRPGEDDFEDLVRMQADPVVSATLGGIVDRDVSRVRFERHLAHWERHHFGWWVARDPDTRQFVGRGGLRLLVVEGREQLELGYGFLAPYWGRGLATELARESVRVAFDVLDGAELVCFTLPTNRASRRVMEKTGFVYDHDGIFADLPHVFYRLTAERWRGLQAEETRP